MKHSIEYFGIRALLFLSRLLPFSIAVRLGGLLGIFAYYVIPIRKKVTFLNVRTAFPDKPEKEIKRICRNAYRTLGMTFFEYLSIFRLSRTKILEMIKLEPADLLQKLIEEERGVIGVSGHFGSFELIGVALSASGIPMDAVIKAMKNERVESELKKIRRSNNIDIITTKEGFSRIIESINRKRMIALVADQDAGDRGVIVPFFGIDTSTPVGPALLAVRTGAPMVAGFIVRKGVAKYTIMLHQVTYEDLPDDTDGKIKEITRRYTSLLESYIKQYPDHYFWMHKRWRSTGLYSNLKK